MENSLKKNSLFYSVKRQITFRQGFSQVPLHGLFHLPLSQQAQLTNLQSELNDIVLDNSYLVIHLELRAYFQ